MEVGFGMLHLPTACPCSTRVSVFFSPWGAAFPPHPHVLPPRLAILMRGHLFVVVLAGLRARESGRASHIPKGPFGPWVRCRYRPMASATPWPTLSGLFVFAPVVAVLSLIVVFAHLVR